MTLKKHSALLLIGLLMPFGSKADVVILNNGDRITGSIVALEGGKLTLTSPYAGKLTLPWPEVAQVQSEDKVRVQLADGTLLNGRLLVSPDGQARVKVGELVETAPFPLTQVSALNPPLDRHKVKLSGRANLGGTYSQGNTEEKTLHANGEVVARTPTNRYTLGAELNESTKDGTETASNWRMQTKYDHFLAEKNYLYALANMEHDGQADLNLRTTLGLGAGRQIIESKDRNLAAECGVSYVNEDYALAPDQDFPSLRAALKYDQLFWGDRLQFFHVSDLLMSLSDSSDYLIKTRTGLRVPVGKGLNFTGQVNMDYDNTPAPGKDTTDSALVFSVGYGF